MKNFKSLIVYKVTLLTFFSPLPVASLYVILFEDPNWLFGLGIVAAYTIFSVYLLTQSIRIGDDAIESRRLGIKFWSVRLSHGRCARGKLRGAWIGTGLLITTDQGTFVGQIPEKVYGPKCIAEVANWFDQR